MDIELSGLAPYRTLLGGRVDRLGRLTQFAALARWGAARWRKPVLHGLALGGAITGIVSIGDGYLIGMWPPHDTSAYWLAGRHLLEGSAVYGGGSSWFLAFLYAPPLAVLMAPISLLPYYVVSAALLGLQLAALRYITGSWTVTLILGWFPFAHYEFVAGNVDCLMAAAIYAGVTRQRGSGIAIALFAFAKFSPAFILVRAPRRQWIEVAVTAIVLIVLTLPVLHLWPEWVQKLAVRTPVTGIIPLPVRLPIVAALLLCGRPWAIAAAAALATPIFYEQSIVLLLPAIRLWWDQHRGAMWKATGIGESGGITATTATPKAA